MPDQEFGSDGQIHDMKTGEMVARPDSLAAREEAVSADPFEASEPASAALRLRAFEDKVIGEDVPRISGNIERGVGSKYQRMTDAQKLQHTAIERLVRAEAHLGHAGAALEKAKAEHEAAIAAIDQAAGQVDGGEDAATG